MDPMPDENTLDCAMKITMEDMPTFQMEIESEIACYTTLDSTSIP